MKFNHYSKQDGLNQSSVNYLFQDSNDYLWIANFGGINRFDGYEFTSYTNDFDNPNSISDNSVWVIYERDDTSLWFGTKAGLSKYNKEHNNFDNFYINTPSNSSGTLAVKALFQDSDGVFYVGSEGQGLFRFSDDTNSFSSISLLPNDLKVTSITEDTNGFLWVGTENKGLFKISKDKSQITNYDSNNLFTNNVIWSLCSDRYGNVWIGTDTDGLVKYTQSTDTFIFMSNDNIKNKYNSGKKIKTIVTDKEDGLWIGSATNGLAHFSFNNNTFHTFEVDPYDNNAIHDSDVSSIFSGSNGVLYVGFYTKGFDKVITTPFKTLKQNPDNPNSLSNNNVYSMYTDSDGLMWFGTFGGGLNRYNPKTEEFLHYKHDGKNENTISHDWVRVIYEDSEGTMWIGTWGGGLNKFDKTKGEFIRYLPDTNSSNALNHNIITAVFEDSKGKIWIGTYGGGINIYRPETDDFSSITHDKNNPESLSDDHITSFYEYEGLIWICTYGGGLNSYDRNTGKFRRYLPDPNNNFSLNNYKTLHIYKEKDSSFFWITTLGGGLNKFYFKENKFMHFTEKDGLSNNSTMGMLRDNKGTYWISSNNGLSRFYPKEASFSNYTTKDGLGSDDYNLEAYTKSDEGLFYFGGKNGVTYFNPTDIELNSNFPKIAITNLRIEDSTYAFIPKEIEANYKERIILDFASINPDIPENIQYSYQLIGQDNKWRSVETIRHLEFTNLSPKNYVLKLKSTNSNKIWNSKYSEIRIKILPPWYMTWYFRVGSILALVIGVIGYYRIQINKAKKQNRLLELKVKERTKTIEEGKVALENQAKLISEQNTELQDLNQLKDRILSILSHDLKTPLSSLDYIVNVFDIDEMIKDKSSLEEYMGLVQSELGKVRSLLDNILLWAKSQITNTKFKADEISIYQIAEEIHELFKEKVEEKHITLINNLKQDELVTADKNILSFILRNLHANAIKFTSNGGSITVDNVVKEDMMIVTVEDNGVGMETEKMNNLFNETHIAWEKGTAGETGTGLGLILCKEFAEKHGGYMHVSSELGKGSAFSFIFPYIKKEEVV